MQRTAQRVASVLLGLLLLLNPASLFSQKIPIAVLDFETMLSGSSSSANSLAKAAKLKPNYRIVYGLPNEYSGYLFSISFSPDYKELVDVLRRPPVTVGRTSLKISPSGLGSPAVYDQLYLQADISITAASKRSSLRIVAMLGLGYGVGTFVVDPGGENEDEGDYNGTVITSSLDITFRFGGTNLILGLGTYNSNPLSVKHVRLGLGF